MKKLIVLSALLLNNSWGMEMQQAYAVNVGGPSSEDIQFRRSLESLKSGESAYNPRYLTPEKIEEFRATVLNPAIQNIVNVTFIGWAWAEWTLPNALNVCEALLASTTLQSSCSPVQPFRQVRYDRVTEQSRLWLLTSTKPNEFKSKFPFMGQFSNGIAGVMPVCDPVLPDSSAGIGTPEGVITQAICYSGKLNNMIDTMNGGVSEFIQMYFTLPEARRMAPEACLEKLYISLGAAANEIKLSILKESGFVHPIRKDLL